VGRNVDDHSFSVGLTRLLLFSAAGFAVEYVEENASDPLAKVRNTDLRWQYFDVVQAPVALDRISVFYD
jgi:hypothetical protein